MSENVESSRAPEPVGAFPHAKRVGNFLFLSGIGPRKRGSKEIPGVTLDPVGNIVSQICALLNTVGDVLGLVTNLLNTLLGLLGGIVGGI